MKIGLTGDIGSGKSTVLAMFSDHGVPSVSADALVHILLREDLDLVENIKQHFGRGVVDVGGQINRSALGKVVFENESQRLVLEGLIHPRVRDAWENFQIKHSNQHSIVEIPLLFEKRLETRFDYIVTVYTSLPIKFNRLNERGMDDAAIRARLDAQLDQESKVNRSNFLILNNGSLDFLRKQVRSCVEIIQHKTN